MNVMCNNPVLYVVDYPSIGAIEVIDKRRGRGSLFCADTARRFRNELLQLASSEDADDFDRLIDGYETLLTQPAVYH